MTWDGGKLATATIAGWHGGRMPVDCYRDERAATWAAETALLDATAYALDAEEEVAALRAAVARLEGERDTAVALTADLMAALERTRADRDARDDWARRWKRVAIRNWERRRQLVVDVASRAHEQLLTTCEWAQAAKERDAARAALAALISDAEIAWHDYHNLARHTGRREGCDLEICRGLRRAVARARAASDGGEG